MADLVRTIDPVDGGDEASDDDAGPTMISGALDFSDLNSQDSEAGGDGAGWDFEAEHAVDEPAGAPLTGLNARIAEKLQEKAANGDVQDNDAPAPASQPDKVEASAEKPKKRKSKASADKAAAAGTPAHLATGIHFSELRISKPLLRALSDLRFDSPTPIQRDVIPSALNGLDILATAETGSGKTASFLLPMLERLCQSANVRARRRDADGRVISGRVATKALVLIPTRELAVQCHAMLKDLAKHTMVTYQLVAGGFVANDQANALRNQPDIVVATPGRMLDHLLNTSSVHMELLEIVVFDEADRLLELGFREECEQVLKCCSKGRQTMLFSATHNDSVDELAKVALVKPVRVKASPINRVAQTLEQEFVKAPSENLREAVLMSLVSRSFSKRVIVFAGTKQSAHRLAIIFGLCGFNFAVIHGGLDQTERVKALTRFQNKEAEFLIATDLAARGLDLAEVETVINFHLPLDVSRYIHRVGRTARMGRSGRAVTIYCAEEYGKVKKLGKQCCSKVESKVLKRNVAADAVQHWSTKIERLQPDIDSVLQEESIDKECRISDIMTGRVDNINKHKAEIHARPAKTWHISEGTKRKLKEEALERTQAIDLEMNSLEDAPDKKVQKVAAVEQNPAEVAEARRKNRIKEKYLKKKADDQKERAKDEAKIRAQARKARKPLKASREEEPLPAHVRNRLGKQKVKKKKKGGGKSKGGGKGQKR